MLSMEDGVLGGGINACDCGTGKTVTCLGLIEQSAKGLADAVAAGTVDVPYFRPTLVACPSQLVDVWYDDWNRFFNGSDRLVFKQFYGSEAIITNPVRKATLLGTKLRDLKDYLAALDPSDPATARVVIVTAYSTWHRRTLMAEEASAEDDPEDKGKGRAEAETETEVDEFDDGYAPDDDDETATVNPMMVYTSSLKGQFARVICDEAHALKNRSTLTHLAIKHLLAPKMWFVSATPMINHVKDLAGYLWLLWKENWSLGMDLDTELFYRDEADLDLLLGHMSGGVGITVAWASYGCFTDPTDTLRIGWIPTIN
jgi:SNF2 family DNA or RNA helicase